MNATEPQAKAVETITVRMHRKLPLEDTVWTCTLPVHPNSEASQKLKDASSTVVDAIHALEVIAATEPMKTIP